MRKPENAGKLIGKGAFTKVWEDKFENERECLLEATDAMANYGSDVCFEISPRNVAAVFGKLVLLDCFFMQDQLRQKRTQKR